jgi:hypothetical protein
MNVIHRITLAIDLDGSDQLVHQNFRAVAFDPKSGDGAGCRVSE